MYRPVTLFIFENAPPLTKEDVDFITINDAVVPIDKKTGELQGEIGEKIEKETKDSLKEDGGKTSEDATADLTLRSDVSLADAEKALEALSGKDLVNEETGISAQINSNQRKKIISAAAQEKSKNNGFTSGQHLAAAERMDKLWKHAVLQEDRTDKNDDPNIRIKRFVAPVAFSKETGVAYLTAKASFEHGHRIYSLELTELKKFQRKGNSLGWANDKKLRGNLGRPTETESTTPHEALNDTIQRALAKVNIKFVEGTNMNTKFYNRRPIKWRIDDDGHLRVTICLLKEGVFEYGREETPQDIPELRGKDIIREYIPLTELKNKEALTTLEGKDIIVGVHEWQTPDIYETAKIVGSVAGTPYVEGDELLCDAIIKCPDTITNITSGRTPEDEKYVEVSAGYDGDLIVEKGEFGGEEYDARQVNYRFNHILLLPSGKGRLGSDVRIVNVKKEDFNMGNEGKVTLKMRFGNTERTFHFTNEDDAREAEGMVEEERKFNAEQVAESLEAKQSLLAQVEELKAQLAEHDANLKAAKEELERAMDEGEQESLAQEMVEQGEEEEEIYNAESEAGEGEEEDKEKEEFLNSIRKTAEGKRATLSMRRENCVRAVMKKQGMEIPHVWKKEAFDAAFATLAVQAHITNKKRAASAKKGRVLNGKQTEGTSDAAKDARSRMLNAMRIKKNKGGKANE